jgi:hypothetical protein
MADIANEETTEQGFREAVMIELPADVMPEDFEDWFKLATARCEEVEIETPEAGPWESYRIGLRASSYYLRDNNPIHHLDAYWAHRNGYLSSIKPEWGSRVLLFGGRARFPRRKSNWVYLARNDHPAMHDYFAGLLESLKMFHPATQIRLRDEIHDEVVAVLAPVVAPDDGLSQWLAEPWPRQRGQTKRDKLSMFGYVYLLHNDSVRRTKEQFSKAKGLSPTSLREYEQELERAGIRVYRGLPLTPAILAQLREAFPSESTFHNGEQSH